MANGSEPSTGFKMPGLMAGFAVSNTTVLIGGALLIAACYIHFSKEKAKTVLREEMKPANIEGKIVQDVIANAAFTETALNNQDRIWAATGRMKPRLKEWRDNYRDGIMSRDEYVAEVRAAWQPVAMSIGIPPKPPSEIPEINKGHRGGSWRRAFRNYS